MFLTPLVVPEDVAVERVVVAPNAAARSEARATSSKRSFCFAFASVLNVINYPLELTNLSVPALAFPATAGNMPRGLVGSRMIP